jgi:hypothetical protein
MFPALKIDLRISLSIVLGNKISLGVTAGESYRISPASTMFLSSSLIKRALFSLILLVGGLIESYGSIRGGLQYPPIN